MAAAVAFRQSDMLVGYIGPPFPFAKRNFMSALKAAAGAGNLRV
ncbi:hypothetical protein MMA231_00147 [Asticcacaulis sp. MM231]